MAAPSNIQYAKARLIQHLPLDTMAFTSHRPPDGRARTIRIEVDLRNKLALTTTCRSLEPKSCTSNSSELQTRAASVVRESRLAVPRGERELQPFPFAFVLDGQRELDPIADAAFREVRLALRPTHVKHFFAREQFR